MLRYSNRSILGVLDNGYSLFLHSENNVTQEVDKFNEVVGDLLENLRVKGANGDSRKKFAVGEETGPNFQTIFGTPDLSKKDCTDCLVEAIREIPFCCENSTRIGVRIIKLGCNIRYEVGDLFFDPTYEDSSLQVSPPTSLKGNSNKSRTIFIIVIIVLLIVALILLLILTCIYFKVKKGKKTIESEAESDEEVIKPIETLHFDFETIRLATDNFSDANKLGEGGFGPVYKPPFCMNSTISSSEMVLRESSSGVTRSSEAQDNSVQASNNECSITELSPR
ncbi:putative receptor-like protein kinase [Senna tora]|uniref:Putative receptor-like protein kinase n=1 Tax=Senna tora TaxID=362788 RepID=A0A834WA02_9FABA|nr:putative receptor-like protein kinase [Senna tora]